MKDKRKELEQMVLKTKGEVEPYRLLINNAAMTSSLLDKLFTQLMHLSTFCKVTTGSMGQIKEDVHPMLVQYISMTRLYHEQLRALGLMSQLTATDGEDELTTLINTLK